jgi:regulator of protease activity HflC (stomatin/prohibitin superfamily)
MSKRSGLVGTVIVVGIVLFFGFIVLMSSYRQIDFGTVGMVTRFGRITGQIMQPGLNWKAPFVDRVITYRTQEIVYITEEQMGEGDLASGTYVDFPTDTTTADGQQITVKSTRASWPAISPKSTKRSTCTRARSRRYKRNLKINYAPC